MTWNLTLPAWLVGILLLFDAKLSSPQALWLWCLCFDSLRVRAVHPAAVTGWGGCSTFVQLGKSLWGASTFACSSCCTWGVIGSSAGLLLVATRMVCPSRGSPCGGCFFSCNLCRCLLFGGLFFSGNISRGQLGVPRNSYPSLIF